MPRGIRAEPLGEIARSVEAIRVEYVTGMKAAITERCKSNRAHLVLQRCSCENLHFFDLRRSCEQFTGPSAQRLRNLAGQMRIAARFTCKGIENAELPR